MSHWTKPDFAPDRRRQRAMAMTSFTLNALAPWIERLDRLEEWAKKETKGEYDPSDARRGIVRALDTLFFATGVEIITDADRIHAGLPPRNEKGLTDDELRVIEEVRLEIMRRPITFPVMETKK